MTHNPPPDSRRPCPDIEWWDSVGAMLGTRVLAYWPDVAHLANGGRITRELAQALLDTLRDARRWRCLVDNAHWNRIQAGPDEENPSCWIIDNTDGRIGLEESARRAGWDEP